MKVFAYHASNVPLLVAGDDTPSKKEAKKPQWLIEQEKAKDLRDQRKAAGIKGRANGSRRRYYRSKA